MSASSKKKLRNEQNAANLTERQKAEQAEAKKLKTMTVVFVTVIALVVAATVGILVSRAVSQSGIIEKNTVAVSIGDHELNTVELNYYYVDAAASFYNSMYNSYSDSAPTYIQLFYGLDVTAPLDEQTNMETGGTWADYFIDMAKTNAQGVYALYDEAVAKNHTLTEEEQASIDTAMSNLKITAAWYGFSDAEDYLEARYGYGTDLESYEDYYTKNTIAMSYQTAYADTLTYDDAALRAHEADKYNTYSSYSYDIYTVSTSTYLEGGTKDDNGNTTYTDEEKAASVTKAEEAANALIEGAATVEDVDKAIAALPENADAETPAATTKYTDRLYTAIDASVAEWLTASGRAENDMTVIPRTTTSTDADGKETTTTNGFYVVVYEGVNENTRTLPAVRHLLVAFEGGTTDSTTNTVTYSDAEKAAAKAEAEELLKQWQDGEATEDSFAALANEKSDDGDGTTGGLYEDITPDTSFVTNFKDWALAEHEVGDVELIETEYGWHIMYYVSAGDTTYRDYMITNELLSADMQTWYDGLLEATTVVDGDTSKLNKDMIIAGSSY